MKRSTRPKPVILILGALLLLTGVLLTPGAVELLGSAVGVSFRVGGSQGAARIWILKFILVVVGALLLLYRFRRRRQARLLFDALMGLVLVVVLLLLVEGVFGVLRRRQLPNGPRTSTSFSEIYAEPNPDLGYWLRPSVQVTATQTSGSDLVYRVRYTTDSQRRRVTPLDNPAGRDKFALFFGGSFTFGDGLADDETLPAAFGRAAPTYFPYNYGMSGYGPQQMLAQLQFLDLPAQVNQSRGVAVYTFICPHVNRAIGSMDVSNQWGASMPYYTLEDDVLVRRGDFVSGRPVLATIYGILGMSETVKYFKLRIPRLTDRHYQLTARIIAEADHEFGRQFGSSQFYVLLYPGTEGCADQLIPHLKSMGLHYLDYSSLFARRQAGLWQPDGHPLPKAQQIVAENLARDLSATEKSAR